MESDRPLAPEDGHPQVWRPWPSMGGRIAIAAVLLAVVCTAAAWAYALSRPPALDSFMAAVAGVTGCLLIALLAIMARGYYSLRYYLSDRELVVSWLWLRETLPLGRIDGVYGGHRLGKVGRVEGIAWSGHYVGSASSESFERVKFFGTSLNPAQVVIVTVSECAYALTPADLDGFRHALIVRLEGLPEEELEHSPPVTTSMPRLLRLSLLRDGMAMALLAGGLVVMLASFGYVAARFPGLPALMPIHYGYTGEPDVIGSPYDAFRMPIIAMIILGANAVLSAAIHRWQQEAARLLAGATVFVELVMLVAVLRVVH